MSKAGQQVFDPASYNGAVIIIIM
uniref:Uncharacterized protein n=1 Tax=Arundo donax TaxID=35708 RepID=A0A0A9FAX4_ARUDO